MDEQFNSNENLNNENSTNNTEGNIYTNNYGSDSYSNYNYSNSNYSNSGYNSSNNYNGNFGEPEKPKKEKKHREKKASSGFGKKLVAALLLGVVFGGAAAGSYYAVDEYIIKDDSEDAATASEMEALQGQVAELQEAVANSSTSTTAIATSVSTDVTSVVDAVMPSMVSIINNGTETTTDWFGRSYSQETQSAGSGIIVGESDEEFFIATNHHVIADCNTLEVTFVDTTTAEAYVKGYDESMDIAVIAVKKADLSADTLAAVAVAELGDSDSLKIGESAIAIGNALGYGQSVTTGVISALNRDMTIDDVTYEDLIQTSAAINPGNSGGALLNVNGQVIGINSSKIGGSTVEGMGFAIPINAVKDMITEFSAREVRTKVSDDEKGYLGIASNDNYTSQLTALGYPAGVYVMSVYDNSPAKEAGIYEGDVITKVDGQSVSSISELSSFLSYYKSGETVTLSVTRREAGEFKELTIDVTLGTKDAITQNN